MGQDDGCRIHMRARSTPTSARNIPANANSHATKAAPNASGGMDASNEMSVAFSTLYVATEYMPRGKTSYQYCGS